MCLSKEKCANSDIITISRSCSSTVLDLISVGVGLLQATSDILGTAGILENDRLIDNYDGSRIVGIDKVNPRTEIVIRAV